MIALSRLSGRHLTADVPFGTLIAAAIGFAMALAARPAAAQVPPFSDTVGDQAFETALTNLLPLRPDQIEELLERLDAAQRASAPPGQPLPEPEIKVENLSLDPGTVPPEILVNAGFVTTVSVLDVTGQPWPIQDIAIGGQFDVPPPSDGSHVLRITPLARHGSGNLSVRLVGYKTPIIFRLTAGSPTVHYRYDARVPEFGPGAEAPLIDTGIAGAAGDGVLMSVLEGVPPAGTLKLSVSGVDRRTSAYLIENTVYVRTPLTLLSPGWDASVSSADGMNVYAAADAPVLLLSDNGVLVRARVSSTPPELQQ